MLTKEQLEQLKPLCDHPIYGKLLSDAIEIWKEENVSPAVGTYGITVDIIYSYFKYLNPDAPFCCLIGATMCNRNIHQEIDHSVSDELVIQNKCSQIYNLSLQEIEDLVAGFDDEPFSFNRNCSNSEAYNFAIEVRKIVLGC